MTDKPKRKQKSKHLPDPIEHAVRNNLIAGGVLSFPFWCTSLAANNAGIGMVLFLPVVLILLAAYGRGIRQRWLYVEAHGTLAQQTRVRAQFWGGVTMTITYLAGMGLALMGLVYIDRLGILATASNPDKVLSTAIVFGLIGAVMWLAEANKRRVYANFGYDPQAMTTRRDTMPDTGRLVEETDRTADTLQSDMQNTAPDEHGTQSREK